MTLCIDTKALIVDSIDESIREVFEMMAGEPLSRNDSNCRLDFVASDDASDSEITVVMSLTGCLQGTLSLSMNEQAALRWTHSLIDHDATAIDQTVVDAVGELGNMFVGGAKRRLTDFSLTMSLPSVIRAGWSCIEFQSNTIPVTIGYDYAGSCIAITIALKRSDSLA